MTLTEAVQETVHSVTDTAQHAVSEAKALLPEKELSCTSKRHVHLLQSRVLFILEKHTNPDDILQYLSKRNMADDLTLATPASREAMSEARLPLQYRDSCAHLAIPLNRCRFETYYLPWKCEVGYSQ